VHLLLSINKHMLIVIDTLLLFVDVSLPLAEHRVHLVVELGKGGGVHLEFLVEEAFHRLKSLEALSDHGDCIVYLLQISGQTLEACSYSVLGVAVYSQIGMELSLSFGCRLDPLRIWAGDCGSFGLWDQRCHLAQMLYFAYLLMLGKELLEIFLALCLQELLK